MANFPTKSAINMADFTVDSDEEDEEIEEINDSTGTTVSVIVQSTMRGLSAEKTRAAFASFPVFDAHDVRNDDVDEYIPILGRKGKIIGMRYTRKNEQLSTKDGKFFRATYVWRNFMDRLDSHKKHYPILDARGNLMGIDSVPKPATIPAAVDKRKQKKISEYYSTTHYVKQVRMQRPVFLGKLRSLRTHLLTIWHGLNGIFDVVPIEYYPQLHDFLSIKKSSNLRLRSVLPYILLRTSFSSSWTFFRATISLRCSRKAMSSASFVSAANSIG